ncbi:importin-like protein [Phytophthora cinnamomi]|uniref:importin-like protein n=1 Tax=Phytophthora cinnamomi TaxID=4785 RepID=UPI00355A1CC3|nr:importin-like protein [Phytophthora cinnamomi]
MKREIDNVVGVLNDQHPRVQYAALQSMGKTAEDFGDDEKGKPFALVGLAVRKECFVNDAKEIVQILVRVQSSEELEGPELNIQQSDVTDGDVKEDGQTADGKGTMTLEIRGVGKKRLEINTSALVDKSNACNMLYQSALDVEG